MCVFVNVHYVEHHIQKNITQPENVYHHNAALRPQQSTERHRFGSAITKVH